jgi:hypothetical protein
LRTEIADIADALEVPIGTAKSRLSLAGCMLTEGILVERLRLPA